MPNLRSIAAVLTAGAASLGGVSLLASSAGAAPTSTPVTGGKTAVVIAPGTAGALLKAAILPLPVNPASETPAEQGSPTVKFSFPITGGALNLSNVTGVIDHSGGLDFYDVATGATLVVEDFDINLGATADITAAVPALGVRVTVFDLNLSNAHITAPGAHTVDVTRIAVTLDKAAAGALDSTFGTKLFTAGLPIGTASTEVHIA